MVWVPQLDLGRLDVWGLGSALPRAVPSDAVVATLGAVLPAAVVQRLLLLGALVLLGVGTARLLRERPLVAQLAAATLAVWNPFVAERLVLGQWPILVACAGFPWLVSALSDERGPRWSVVILAMAASALSPVSGVMGLVLGVVAAWRRGVVRVVVLAALLNAPWIVAGIISDALTRTDPAAVGLFDLQAEGHFGKLGSALTLGGIWNTEVVPTSRTLWIAVALALVIGAVTVVGLVTLWHGDRRLLVVLGTAGALGLTVALAGWLVPEQVARVVAGVPAGGIVRDGTRWLALLVPLEAAAFGVGVSATLHRARLTAWQAPVAVLALIVPLAALPDLAWGVAGRVRPATYPTSWTDARKIIEASEVTGDVLVLPFSAYRRPSWNHDTPVLDPAGRYFGRTTVTNDELVVSGRPIAGEDPRAAGIGRVLKGGDVVPALARSGIGIVVLETDAPGAVQAARSVKKADEVEVQGTGLRVFTVPDARATIALAQDRRAMIAAWGAAGLTLLFGMLGGARAAISRFGRQPARHRTREEPKS